VPCTPRVITRGLCSIHFGSAILDGNLAANLVLKTTLPVEIVDRRNCSLWDLPFEQRPLSTLEETLA